MTPASVLNIPDGSGGTYVCWTDNRNGSYDVFLQRLDSDGAVVSGWPSTGWAVCSAAGSQIKPRIAQDGAGGALVVWEDNRAPSSGSNIYAIRATSSGAVASGWASNGVPVDTAQGGQFDPDVVADGNGGAVISYRDSSTIYAKRLSSSGSMSWSNSAAASADSLTAPRAVADASNGMIVVYRAGGALFGQRFRGSDGTRLWSGSGSYTQVCPIDSTGFLTSDPAVCSDDAEGVFVAYAKNDVFLQRVTASGTVWNSRLTVCSADSAQRLPKVVADGANGAIVAWVDDRTTSYTDPDVYAQRVRAGPSYATCWTSNGVAIFSGVLADPTMSMAGDGHGGAFIAVSTNDISARHIKASGTLETSYLVSYPDGVQDHTSIAITDTSHVIVSWWDGRNSLQGVYANRVAFANAAAPHGLTTLSVIDLGRHTALIGWTGPADDSVFGAAGSFVVRRSTSPITEANFDFDTFVEEVPTSGGAGTSYCLLISDLTSCANQYFAIRTRFGCQLSLISNAVTGQTTCSGGDVSDCNFLTGGGGGEESRLRPIGPATLTLSMPALAHGGSVAMRVDVPRALVGAPLSLCAYDLSGRVVRRIARGATSPGTTEFTWDGRNEAGMTVRSGMYYVRVVVGETHITHPILLLH